MQQWPEGGPKRVWLNEDAGLGYGGPAIVKGVLYLTGARGENEYLLAINDKDGKEIWHTEIGSILKNNWGNGPRGTPSVDGDSVYVLGGQGTLICVNAKDGKKQWSKTMEELGGSVPTWGYTESVLVDDKNVYCTPGGEKGAIAALDKKTGEVRWQSREFTEKAQYSSIVPGEINGKRQLVQLVMNSVVGIDPANGKLLWKSPWPGRTAVIPTPVVHDNHVYVTSGYGVGCKLIKVGPDNKVEDVYENKVMKNHHGGVVLVDGKIYGHSDGYAWVCQDFMKGDEVWGSKQLGKGAVTYADGRLYCLEEGSGTVVLAEASPQGRAEHGRFKLDPQTKLRSPQGRIWTHPVVANGKLYLRDQELLSCYDIKAGK